jgi:hypothetical protein
MFFTNIEIIKQIPFSHKKIKYFHCQVWCVKHQPHNVKHMLQTTQANQNQSLQQELAIFHALPTETKKNPFPSVKI